MTAAKHKGGLEEDADTVFRFAVAMWVRHEAEDPTFFRRLIPWSKAFPGGHFWQRIIEKAAPHVTNGSPLTARDVAFMLPPDERERFEKLIESAIYVEDTLAFEEAFGRLKLAHAKSRLQELAGKEFTSNEDLLRELGDFLESADEPDDPPAVAGTDFPLLTIDELEQLPPPKWITKDILPEGGLVVFFGPPGEGKTFVALDLALRVAAGLEWYGHAVRQGRVLYALGEGRGGVGNRVQAWAAGRHGEQLARCRENFLLCPAVPHLRDGKSLRAFLAVLKTIDPAPALILVDTFARSLLGGDENSAKDVGEAIEGLDAIRRQTGATILAVHHTGKDGKERGARGSSALHGAADAMFSVSAANGGIHVVCEKQKDAEPCRPLDLALEVVDLGPGPDGALTSCRVRARTSGEKAADLAKSSRAILDLLSQPEHAPGLPKTEILGLLDNMPKSTFYAGIKPLLGDRTVAKVGGRFIKQIREPGEDA